MKAVKAMKDNESAPNKALCLFAFEGIQKTFKRPSEDCLEGLLRISKPLEGF